MSYQALYRSWRPQTFSDLVGQPHVMQTLTNAILSSQVAHAYLFCGPRGTGKTSAAKVLAKAVNCEARDGVDPCNACEACTSITAGNNVDVEEIDAASNRGVDEIRQLRDKVQYAPTRLVHKVYIIDEVHMLTAEAFNALLKTLEEPPGHTLFILATTEPHKIPGTIVSRCQRFDFRRIEPETIVQRLQLICSSEGWQAEEEALWKVAQAADGGLRDALGLLEQTAAHGRGQVTSESAAHVVGGVDSTALLSLVESLTGGDLMAVVQRLTEWYGAGKDAARIVQDLLQVLRDLFIVKLSSNDSAGAIPGVSREAYAKIATQCDTQWLLAAVKKLGDIYTNLRYVDQPRLALEAAVLGLAPAPRAAQPTARSPVAVAVAPEPVAPAVPAAAAALAAPPATTAPIAPVPVASVATPAARTPKSTSPARKWEVLQDLSARADTGVLAEIQAVWTKVLDGVRAQRIQLHAWLMNGQLILATGDEVVLAFSSPIHRNAVMKPAERALIESALAEAVGKPLRILALTRTDWEEFERRQNQTVATEPEVNLIDRAIAVFGKERVEIRDGE